MSMPIPATPAMPTQEYSSLRNTFSISRCEIMLPEVARRSPAITTPPSQTAVTIVVPCGMSAAAPAPRGSAADRLSPCAGLGSSSGAAIVRKSVKDEDPAARNADACQRAWGSKPPTAKSFHLLPTTKRGPAFGGLPDVTRVGNRGSPECCRRPTAIAVLSDPKPATDNGAPGMRAVASRLLAALLHIGPDEFLGVFLQHLVDLVQDRVDIVSQLVLPLTYLISFLDVGVLLLLGPPGCLPLSAGVLCRHAITSVLRGATRDLNAILACRCPIQPWRTASVSRRDNSWPE